MFRGLSKSKSIKRSQISDPMMMHQSHGSIDSVPPTPPLPQLVKKSSFSSSCSNASTIAPSNSNNTAATPRTTPASNAVILITKFDFKAEHSNELTVGVGEALKLIEKKGNGWILVKPIGRISQPGLIPASYVRIVKLGSDQSRNLNTKYNQEWLASEDSSDLSMSPKSGSLNSNKTSSVDTSTSSDQEQHFSFQSTSSTSRPSSPNSISSTPSTQLEKQHSQQTQTPANIIPISALVKNVSCYNGRYWYRIDVELSDGKKRHLCRYYQDFYKLHCSIVGALRTSNVSEEEQDLNCAKLPGLPDPIPRPDLETLSSILLQRCQSLNVYIFKIVQNKHKLEYYDILKEWCLPRLGDLESDAKYPLSNEAIEELLKPIPTSLNKTNKKPSLKIQTSVTPPLPVPELPPNSFLSKNNSISSISPISSPVQSPAVWSSPQSSSYKERTNSTVSVTTSRITSRPTFNSETQESWMSTPTEPLFSHRNSREKFVTKRNESVSSLKSTQVLEPEILKIKIYYNNDIFALKFDKNNSKLQDLRNSISKRLECEVDVIKLYYKNASKNYFSPLLDEFDLYSAMEQPKVSIKVHLW